jgi:ABC-type glycerol-3-phosphate transport system substrate-binding protein
VIQQDVIIKQGSTPMDKDLSFGGKTFTMAVTSEITYATNAFKRLKNAFEKQYDCKLEISTLPFDQYNQQVAAKMSTGKSYDICLQHGSMYPAGVVNKLFEPMTEAITTADLMDTGNPMAGGIDYNKSMAFAWNNQLYGLTSYWASNPYLIYYNKKMVSDNGLDDPRKLYDQGKWDWAALQKLGGAITDESRGLYLGGSSFYSRALVLANGSDYIRFDAGKPVINLSDKKVYNAYKFIQDAFYGSKKIMTKEDVFNDTKNFYAGKLLMFTEESDRYSVIMAEIPKQNAFGKNADNLGIVPLPLGPDNTEKLYPTGWLTAVFAGAGTEEKRAAAAWAKFRGSYKDPVKDTYAFNAKDQAMLESLIKNIVFERSNFSNSSDQATKLIYNINESIVGGADITKTINDNLGKLQACIDATLG